MDSKLILKSSTKVPLSERFSKMQSRPNDRPTSSTYLRSRTGSGHPYNPLSVTLKRGATSSRKGVSNQGSAWFRVGDKQKKGGDTILRKRTPVLKTSFQTYAAEYAPPRRGGMRSGAIRGGGYQRGGYKGVQSNTFKNNNNNNTTPTTWSKPKNKPFVKRQTQPSAKKEDLDKDLEKYMSRTKGYLDEQLDAYHNQD